MDSRVTTQYFYDNCQVDTPQDGPPVISAVAEAPAEEAATA
jgi:hypothetical protein